MSLLHLFQEQCDIFRKLPVEVRQQEQSAGSTFASRGVQVLVVVLCLVTAFDWNTVRLEETFEIDGTNTMVSSPERLRVEIDVTVYKAPCIAVSLDYQDKLGNRDANVKTVMKQRIRNNQAVGDLTMNDPVRKAEGEGAESTTTRAPGAPCGDCFGAGRPGQCCDTCSDVMYAYRAKRWASPRPGQIPQCANMTSMDPVSLYQPPQIVHANSFNSTLLRERLMSLEMRPIGSGNTTRNITPLAITFGPLEQSAS